jgi:CRP-like cAMP-binding protein
MSSEDTTEHLNLEPGEVLFREGDAGNIMYVIAEGSLRVEKGQGDDMQILTTLQSGEFVGEMSVLIGSKRTATVIAEEACDLLPYDADTLGELLHRSPTIAMRIIRLLASRLKDTTDRATQTDIEAIFVDDD